MENSIDNLLASAPAEGTTEVSAKDAERKAEKREQKALVFKQLTENIQNDPTLEQRFEAWSQSLEVTHTLTYSDKGGLIVDPNGKEQRGLLNVPRIVGYEVRNCGTTPIPYKTAVCEKNADGIYTETTTDAVLQPGATAYLTRQYMTMLCAMPEISFKLKNGRIAKGSSNTKDKKSTRDALEAFYFTFDKKLGMSVNGATVAVPVAVESGDGHWVVKPEFEETFGFLSNPKEVKATKRRKKSGSKYDNNIAVANYVYNVVIPGEDK